jgi:hypothetical protein
LNAAKERIYSCACRNTGLQIEGSNNLGFRIAIAPPANKINKASISTLSKEFSLFVP